MSSASYGDALSLGNRLSGKESHDFTVVYKADFSNTLSRMPQNHLEKEINNKVDAIEKQSSLSEQNRSVMESVRQSTLVNLSPAYLRSQQFIITISERGDRLLFKRYNNTTKELLTVVYDGQRTLSTIYGSDAQIVPGFNYLNFGEFAFPGTPVCGIPYAQNLSAIPLKQGLYHANIAFNDGFLDNSNLPSYYSGLISTQVFDGMETVVHTQAGVPGQLEQECSYGSYRKVGADLAFPTEITLKESYSPEHVLPFGQYKTIRYSLVSASAEALPESKFTIEGALSKKTSFVQDNEAKKAVSIRYVPGKTLAQQFEDRRKLLEKGNEYQTQNSGSDYRTGLFGLAAIVFAMCGFFFYRRSKASGN